MLKRRVVVRGSVDSPPRPWRHRVEVMTQVQGQEAAQKEEGGLRVLLPKKQGFMSRMQENFAVLKENDTIVVVQAWDSVEINVDVLKPCKGCCATRQKVRQFIAKRDDIMPEVENMNT